MALFTWDESQAHNPQGHANSGHLLDTYDKKGTVLGALYALSFGKQFIIPALQAEKLRL